jgi:hypothetical protein
MNGRQLARAGIGFTELSNGFASCQDPQALQAVCDRLGPGAITVFFERWMSRIPLPLTAADRTAGYWWELSMRQVEVSRTIVFDAPRNARAFFEALVADNLDLGRPERRADLRARAEGPYRQAAEDTPGLQDRHRPLPVPGAVDHGGDHQRVLQEIPHQAVPQGRPRAADRDRGQLTR